MAGLANYLFNTAYYTFFGDASTERLKAPPTSFYDSDRYTPSVEDVLSVKETLFKKFELPLELIDSIIDFAEYWPCTTTCRTGGELHVRSGRPGLEDQFLLRSYPLGYTPTKSDAMICEMASARTHPFPIIPATPWNNYTGPLREENTEEVKARWTNRTQIRGEHPCRRVVFKIVSHDQGWGGNTADRGTYKGSFTWFDVGKERVHTSEDISNIRDETPNAFPTALHEGRPIDTRRSSSLLACTVETIAPTVHPSSPDKFEHPLMPTSKCLQKNLTATRESHEHKIVWSCQDDILDPDSIAAKVLEDEGRGRETANGEYVRDMKIGDVVTLWAKARFPGWVNVVEAVQIDVYYAV